LHYGGGELAAHSGGRRAFAEAFREDGGDVGTEPAWKNVAILQRRGNVRPLVPALDTRVSGMRGGEGKEPPGWDLQHLQSDRTRPEIRQEAAEQKYVALTQRLSEGAGLPVDTSVLLAECLMGRGHPARIADFLERSSKTFPREFRLRFLQGVALTVANSRPL